MDLVIRITYRLPTNVKEMVLPEEEKAKILGGNAQKLLKLT
jgi:predicted TIM-barrel fold metal-dependent hydrolase